MPGMAKPLLPLLISMRKEGSERLIACYGMFYSLLYDLRHDFGVAFLELPFP